MKEYRLFMVWAVIMLTVATGVHAQLLEFDTIVQELIYGPAEPERVPQVSLHTITFRINSAKLTQQSASQLEVVVAVLQLPELIDQTGTTTVLTAALPEEDSEAALILGELLENHLFEEDFLLNQKTVREEGLQHTLVFAQTILYDQIERFGRLVSVPKLAGL